MAVGWSMTPSALARAIQERALTLEQDWRSARLSAPALTLPGASRGSHPGSPAPSPRRALGYSILQTERMALWSDLSLPTVCPSLPIRT